MNSNTAVALVGGCVLLVLVLVGGGTMTGGRLGGSMMGSGGMGGLGWTGILLVFLVGVVAAVLVLGDREKKA